jgi:hypothetical protein
MDQLLRIMEACSDLGDAAAPAVVVTLGGRE